ncbi:MAG: helix-turn-helix transcriptional regulator [Treponema sp.]|nr:helix-turn-helix transcriptional regulator [Treponema sp.]
MAMNSETFSRLRSLLGRSQRELADILGVSLKTVESYEQGWRRVPANIERILYFLLFKLNEGALAREPPCWEATDCPDSSREHCVAYLAKEGRFCWFFTGRLCAASEPGGEVACRACPVFARLLESVQSAADRRGAKPGRVPAK